MTEHTKERWEKLLTFACSLGGIVDATRLALRFTNDLILGAAIGSVAGGVLGGLAAGLISAALDEPVLLVYAAVALGLVIVLRTLLAGTWMALLLAW